LVHFDFQYSVPKAVDCLKRVRLIGSGQSGRSPETFLHGKNNHSGWDPDGKKDTLKLSKKVNNMDQLKPGETVDMVMTESLVVEIVK
jgi:hypothetical protein